MVIFNLIFCFCLLGLVGMALWEVLPQMFKSNNPLEHLMAVCIMGMCLIAILIMVSGHVFLSSMEKKSVKKEKVQIETPVDQEKDDSWERYHKLRQ